MESAASDGRCTLVLKLADDLGPRARVVRIEFRGVVDLTLRKLGGGMTQRCDLMVEDIRSQQLDRVHYRVFDAEHDAFEWFCDSFGCTPTSGIFSSALPCECDWLGRAAAEPGVAVAFDAALNEYHLIHEGRGGRGALMLRYCPFCGGAAPKSRRPERFMRLTQAELARLESLVSPLQTLADVIGAFGAPDEELDPGDGSCQPHPFDAPPRFERGRTLIYRGLSESAEVRATQHADGRVRFDFVGKPVAQAGPDEPGEDPEGE